MEIKDRKQLEAQIKSLAKKMLEGAAEELLEIFREDYIQKMVYDSHGPNKVYDNPNGQEFKNAWEWTDIKQDANSIFTELWYNYKDMSHDPNYFNKLIGIHGSTVEGWDSDERPYLMETLNKVGYSSSLWVSVNRKKAYWNEFLKAMYSEGKLDKLLDKHARKVGFVRA